MRPYPNWQCPASVDERLLVIGGAMSWNSPRERSEQFNTVFREE
jgi:hypothetical protein